MSTYNNLSLILRGALLLLVSKYCYSQDSSDDYYDSEYYDTDSANTDASDSYYYGDDVYYAGYEGYGDGGDGVEYYYFDNDDDTGILDFSVTDYTESDESVDDSDDSENSNNYADDSQYDTDDYADDDAASENVDTSLEVADYSDLSGNNENSTEWDEDHSFDPDSKNAIEPDADSMLMAESDDFDWGNKQETTAVDELEELEQSMNDPSEVGQVYYDESESGGVIGALGFDDTVNARDRSQMTNHTEDATEFSLDVLRAIQKNKKHGGGGFPRGAISAFDKSKTLQRSGLTSMNCERGWQSDSKTCANSCRVEFIKSGGRKNNRATLYKNQRFVRCEICAIKSGLVPSASFFQKSLSNMKRGAPYFCKKSEAGCVEKEEIFAACSGTAICAKACWSPTSNKEDCLKCERKWCIGVTKASNKKFFLVCSKFRRCFTKYHPDDYSTSEPERQYEGTVDCWGSPLDAPKITAVVKHEYESKHEICRKAHITNQNYAIWKNYFEKCTEIVCDMSEENARERNPTMCSELHCKKACLISNGASAECRDCGICAHCDIKSLLKTGNYDRGLYGATNPAVVQVGMHQKGYRNGLEREKLKPMTAFIKSQLHKGKCTMCDQMQERIDCRYACDQYNNMRVNSHDRNDPNYLLNFSLCTSMKCFRHVNIGCKTCTKKCELYGRKKWDTALGSSDYNINFNGFGCSEDCKSKWISQLSSFKGVDFLTEGNRMLTETFDTISMMEVPELNMEEQQALIDWTNNGRTGIYSDV